MERVLKRSLIIFPLVTPSNSSSRAHGQEHRQGQKACKTRSTLQYHHGYKVIHWLVTWAEITNCASVSSKWVLLPEDSEHKVNHGHPQWTTCDLTPPLLLTEQNLTGSCLAQTRSELNRYAFRTGHLLPLWLIRKCCALLIDLFKVM